MALADYDTSVEKIAALKAAVLDPSLVQVNTTNFTSNGISYIFLSDIFGVNNKKIIPYADYVNVLDTYRVKNGDVVAELNNIMLYIKDSDITYSDPVTTYQNRLAASYTSELIIINNNESFVSGTYGSIITQIYNCKYNGLYLTENNTIAKFAIPAGVTILAPIGVNNTCSYFDVPSDW